jgi:hypothetical protein
MNRPLFHPEHLRIAAEVRTKARRRRWLDLAGATPATTIPCAGAYAGENLASIQEEINDIYKDKFGPKRKWPARFHVSSYPIDFSDLESFGNLPALFNKQIFVFCYVVSEVFDLSLFDPSWGRL